MLDGSVNSVQLAEMQEILVATARRDL